MNCPMLNLLAKRSYCGGMFCLFCVQLTIVVIAIAFGGLVTWKPRKVIEIQIALYRPFNWKIEPISMEKEIRNTRIMGLAVLVLGIFSLAWILLS
ncbi:MAG: hypothetical protein AABY55_03055 [Candidatus Omnitrophota bacterium]